MARSRLSPVDPIETAAEEIQASLAQIEKRLDEVAKLLALLVRRDKSLQDAVADLAGVKLGPTRIGQLLGTSPAYAKVAADRARKRKASGKRAAKR